MKFTLNWLREFVAFDGAPEKLAEWLTMAGLEVESLKSERDPETNEPDWIFELSVTPNRGDCLGIAGLAREVCALTGAALKLPSTGSQDLGSPPEKRVSVAIDDSRLCARYSARIIDDVDLAPSPAQMRFRLEACGIRAINNIVDITNYVMLETGQPLHAFDLDRLPRRAIVVRPAGDRKHFVTLDGFERELRSEDLLICDANVPVALAGIMGGAESEVAAATRSLLLESASFDPMTIRRTAKRLGIHTEASHRFERGVDPEGTVAALNRAVELLRQYAGARLPAGTVDAYPRRPKPHAIAVREEEVARLLGIRMNTVEMERLLRALGLDIEPAGPAGVVQVLTSSRRPDLSREADFIEEIARLHGYNRIPSTLPLLRPSGGRRDERLEHERRIRCVLAGQGLLEVVNLPFTTEEMNRYFPGIWQESALPVRVQNPLAKEAAEMRSSLIPGLLENLRTNIAHKAESFYAYHLGKVFRLRGAEPEERQTLAGLLFGPRPHSGLRQRDFEPAAFLDCKGVVETVLDSLRIGAVHWRPESPPAIHPGRAAGLMLHDERIGYLGQLHPELCDALGLPQALVFELDFERLLQYAPRQITAAPLPRFPAVERDVAVVVDRAFPSQQIITWIESLGEPLIKHIEVFDQYLGSPIPEGKKSLAYKISYRADDRTLVDAEVQALHQRIVAKMAEVFGAQLRS